MLVIARKRFEAIQVSGPATIYVDRNCRLSIEAPSTTHVRRAGLGTLPPVSVALLLGVGNLEDEQGIDIDAL